MSQPRRDPPHVLLPEDRYQRETMFRSIVDIMEAFMHRAELTPTEIREAAQLAAMHFEMRRVDRFRWVGGAIAEHDPREPSAHAGDTPPAVFVNGVLYRRE